MKTKTLSLFAAPFALALLLASCKSTEQQVAEEEPIPVVQEAPAKAEPEPEVKEEPAPEPPAKKEEPAPEPPASEDDLEYQRSVGSMGQKVSKETFNADKAAILKKIEDLNVIMTKKDFNSWSKHIEQNSKKYWSQIPNLTKASEKLPKEAKGVRLRTLQDYFNYVFIPSRRGRQIDEIRYNSADSIKAVQVRKKDDGTTNAVVYYNFVREGGDWKVYLPRL